jgi:site-specific DNA recombinase
MRAAIYARKSKQDEASLDRQVELAKDFIAKQDGWRLHPAHIFSDDGISGAQFTRPGLDALLAAVGRTPVPFDVLVVMESSRLGRNMSETLKLQEQILESGTRLYHYQDGSELKLDTPTQKLVASVNNFGAEDYRYQISQKASAALRKKAQAGHAVGNRCYGYANVCQGCGKDHGPKQRHCQHAHVLQVVHEPQAAIVRRIFQLYVGGQGTRSICRTLNAQHIAAPRGKEWRQVAVRDLLANPIYTGQVVYGKTAPRLGAKKTPGRRRRLPESQWVKVALPRLRIVEDSLWHAAQARRAELNAVYMRNTAGKLQSKPVNSIESQYLLSGLLACGTCGGPMGIAQRSGGKFLHLRCRRSSDLGVAVCSNGKMIPMARAERVILDAVESELAEDVLLRYVHPHIGQPPTPDALATERARLTAALSDATKACEKLVAAIETEGGALPTLIARLKDRERAQRDYQAQLAELDGQAGQPELDLSELGARIKLAARGWQHIATMHPQVARARLKKLLGGRLTVHPPDATGVVRFEGQLNLGPLLAEMKLPSFRSPRTDVTRRSTGPTAGPTRPRRCASPSSPRPSS